ncbi:hypothetical protein V6U90_13450 [Micromonospora sp. CPCC 206060]|uniref:hypothetical protein n=1 Tax=Micromonospora sp. CPCC 206060 TaxID=3122406 RepID=UPI002FF21AF1
MTIHQVAAYMLKHFFDVQFELQWHHPRQRNNLVQLRDAAIHPMPVLDSEFCSDGSACRHPSPPPTATRILPSVSSLNATIIIAFRKVNEELVNFCDDRIDLVFPYRIDT